MSSEEPSKKTSHFVMAGILSVFATLALTVIYAFHVQGVVSVRPMPSVLVSAFLMSIFVGPIYGLVFRLIPIARTLGRSILIASLFGCLWLFGLPAPTVVDLMKALSCSIINGALMHVIITWLSRAERCAETRLAPNNDVTSVADRKNDK